MARTVKAELQIEGYVAQVTREETVVRAMGRGYDQRDERAYEVALRIPAGDLERVAALLSEACDASEAMA